MAKPKALAYAEDTLRVHEVYDDAKRSRDELDAIFTDLDALYSKRRELQDSIADREVDITVEERTKHPDHSVAEFERHLKVVRGQDETLKGLRRKSNEIESDIDGRRFDRSLAEKDIEIACARMIELNGYFIYLVQAKQQTKTPEASEANEAEKSQ